MKIRRGPAAAIRDKHRMKPLFRKIGMGRQGPSSFFILPCPLTTGRRYHRLDIRQKRFQIQIVFSSHVPQGFKEGLAADALTDQRVVSLENRLGLPVAGNDIQNGHLRVNGIVCIRHDGVLTWLFFHPKPGPGLRGSA